MTYVVEKSPGKEESINFPLFSEGWKLSIEANDIERAAQILVKGFFLLC